MPSLLTLSEFKGTLGLRTKLLDLGNILLHGFVISECAALASEVLDPTLDHGPSQHSLFDFHWRIKRGTHRRFLSTRIFRRLEEGGCQNQVWRPP